MKKFMTQWTMLCVLVGLCATAQAVTLAEAIDLPDATITTSGYGWEATTDRAQTGGYCARSQNYRVSSSTASMTLTVTGPGTLSFKWYAYGESGCDYLYYTIDGGSQSSHAPSSWTTVTLDITGSGTHTITWTYRKDGSVNNDPDRGYVDCVTWTVASFLQEIYVNAATGNDANTGASATQAKKTIQSAIDAAAAGGTIYVAAGTYAPITVNKQLTIQGAGSDKTIIDGGGTSRCAYFSGTSGYVLKNVKLQNGYISGGNGGGAYYGTLEDCIIDNCRTPTSSGGGAYQSVLWRCRILRCQASYNGGGTYSGEAHDCLYSGNSSSQYGGGAYSTTLYNCTLYGNSSASYGGAAYSGSAYNSIAYGNTSSYSSSASYQNFYSVSTYSCYTSDPMFADAANGDFRLRPGSPCIDAGDNSYASAGTDLNGLVRVVSAAVDIGCCEIQMAPEKHTISRLDDFYYLFFVTREVVIQGNVTAIPACAFAGASLLERVTISSSVTSIGDNAFDGCSALSYVRFPEGWVFRSADLARMGVPQSFIDRFTTADGNWIIMGSTLIAYVGNENVTTLTIPDGIDIIDDEALADLYCLQTVTFAGTERIIGKRAFYECTDLEYVELPETVETIEESAFENCTWIDDVYFPTELKTVGKKAFKGCGQLLECAFYEGFESIGDNAFEGCWRMLSVNLPHSVANVGTGAFSGCDTIIGVVTPSNIKTMSSLFPAAYTRIEQAIIPEGETDIMNSMFSGCTSLDSLVIATTVTNIGTSAFSSCRSLVYQAIPDSVVRLGASAFENCSSLELVALSRNLKALENYTFRECHDLTSIIVPASVRTLGSSLFACTHPAELASVTMRDVYFLGDMPETRSDTYSGTTAALVTHVVKGSRGWDGIATSKSLPKSWLSHAITYWSPNIFEVTFDPNGGGPEPYKANQITDTTYALPDVDPTRPGYTFAGWWTQPEGGGEVINTTVVHATRAHTLYAHWEPARTIEILFNPMGGTVEPDSGYYTAGATHVKFPVPTRRGYTFAGWWTGADAGENISESVRVPTVPGTLYAHWTPITYKVEFRSNNGQNLVTTQTFIFNVKGALQANPYTYADRNFIGWARTAGGSVVHTDGDEVLNWCETQDDKVILYAKWDGARYAVRFDENGGSGFMTNQTILVNATAALSENKFTREGYTFQGWSLTATGAVVYRDKASVNNLAGDDGNIVLYAQWKANTYTVRYHYNYGSSTVTKDQTMTYGVAANLLYVNSGLGWTNPSGCSFLGWGETATADLARYANGEKVLNLASGQGAIVHLYAIWMGGAQYAVKFHKNDGGADEVMQQLYNVNQRKHLAWKDSQIGWTRVGYTFMGWAKSATATTPNYLNGETVENIAAKGQTLNLYAVWKPGQVPYKVRFHKNFGDNATCDEAFVFGKEQNLYWKDSQLKWSRSGYTFVGWGTSAGSNVGVYANGEKVLDLATAKEQVVHLYAIWAQNSSHYVLKLYRQQESGDTVTASVRMPKGVATSIPWKDSQLGWVLQDCTFLGWATAANTRLAKYVNGEKVTDLAPVGNTASLYAVWQPKNTYVVKFHRVTGPTDTTTALQWFYRGTASGLAWQGGGLGWTPSGLTFCGWSRSATSATVSYTNGQSVQDLAAAGATIDLYAVWSYQTAFNQNAGAGSLTATRTYYIGQQAQLPWLDGGLKFTRTGYTFLGWALTPAGKVVYQNGAKALNIIYSGSTLYARWQANPPALAAMRTTSTSLQNAPKASSRTWTAGYYRGEFADGSGTFDLLLEENGSAFFRAETEDGVWSAECEAEVVGGTLLLTFEAIASIGIGLEGGVLTAFLVY